MDSSLGYVPEVLATAFLGTVLLVVAVELPERVPVPVGVGFFGRVFELEAVVAFAVVFAAVFARVVLRAGVFAAATAVTGSEAMRSESIGRFLPFTTNAY